MFTIIRTEWNLIPHIKQITCICCKLYLRLELDDLSERYVTSERGLSFYLTLLVFPKWVDDGTYHIVYESAIYKIRHKSQAWGLLLLEP